MDKKLYQVLVLYDEEPESTGDADLAIDADLGELRLTKRMLDARARRIPRSTSVDAVQAAARQAWVRETVIDRDARRRPRRVWLQRLAVPVALLVIALSIWILMPPDSMDRVVGDGLEASETSIALQNKEPVYEPSESTVVLPSEPHLVLERDSPPAGQNEVPGIGANNSPIALSRELTNPMPTGEVSSGAESSASASAVRCRRDESAVASGFISAQPSVVTSADLSWDHSDETRELYRQVERLSRVSPADDAWRTPPTRRVLSAPVGLAVPQHVSVQSGF